MQHRTYEGGKTCLSMGLKAKLLVNKIGGGRQLVSLSFEMPGYGTFVL